MSTAFEFIKPYTPHNKPICLTLSFLRKWTKPSSTHQWLTIQENNTISSRQAPCHPDPGVVKGWHINHWICPPAVMTEDSYDRSISTKGIVRPEELQTYSWISLTTIDTLYMWFCSFPTPLLGHSNKNNFGLAKSPLSINGFSQRSSPWRLHSFAAGTIRCPCHQQPRFGDPTVNLPRKDVANHQDTLRLPQEVTTCKENGQRYGWFLKWWYPHFTPQNDRF